jgi:N-acetylglutamate synthase and related acetyltransferases
MDADDKGLQVQRASGSQLESAYGVAEEYFAQMSVLARDTRDQFEKEYFAEGVGFWLAKREEAVVGCIGLRRMCIASSAEIKRMYVRQEYRGRGFAQKLLEAAEEFARKCGYQWIYLDTTDEMMAAVRLYERNGYKRCERYNQNPQATIFMRKRLRGV